jgi:hypothetical protein
VPVSIFFVGAIILGLSKIKFGFDRGRRTSIETTRLLARRNFHEAVVTVGTIY